MTITMGNKLSDDKKGTKKDKILDEYSTDIPGFILP